MPDLRVLFTEATPSTTLSTSYQMVENGNVEIEIIIGDIGQLGTSEVWLNNNKILPDIQGSFKWTGDANELRNQVMNIYTIVTDTSRSTNYTEVALDIWGGFSSFHNRMHKEVAEEGESVFYENEIFFYI